MKNPKIRTSPWSARLRTIEHVMTPWISVDGESIFAVRKFSVERSVQ